MIIDTHTLHFHIRTVRSSDKDDFMALRRETSDMSRAYDLYPEYLDQDWGQVLKDEQEINMMAFRNNVFVGICSFQFTDRDQDSVDIGYNIAKAYRNKGIGTKLASDMVSLAHKEFPGRDVLIRTRAKNKASQRVAEKCGGVLIGKEPTPEAKIFQDSLSKYGDGQTDEHGDRMGEDQIKKLRQVVEEGKEGVWVYRMP